MPGGLFLFMASKKTIKRIARYKRNPKESQIDAQFSAFIRTRDGQCMFPLRSSEDYHNGVLQCSHFYGRGARSVRWDEENCDGICARHHQFLEGRKNAEYADWKLKQLGEERFQALRRRYYTLKQYTPQEKREIYERYKVPSMPETIRYKPIKGQ